jgi:protein-S-isoprenylcysteine O-methyltransferase Ste14
MTREQVKDSPNVVSYPPLVFFGAFALGLLLNWLLPMRSFSSELWRAAGGMLGLTGSLLATWGVYAMHRAGTPVRPGFPATALVTNGPFRYSRNPLYLALTIIYIGGTMSLGSWWPLATLVPALAVVHWKIVRREEDYLESQFSDAYRAYKAQVRRWV